MARPRHKNHNRQPARLNHLIQMEDALNEDLQVKVTEFIARYHLEHIGSPMTGPSIEERLRLVERLSVKWWIATAILWVRDRVVLYLAMRNAPEPEPEMDEE